MPARRQSRIPPRRKTRNGLLDTAIGRMRAALTEDDRAETEPSGDERVPAPEAAGPARKPPAEAIAEARVRAPSRGNRRLESFLAAINEDDEVRAWWYMAQVHSERLGMSDHSWVHVQIVLNVSLRLLRLLAKAGVEPAMVTDHGMGQRDAEVVVAAGSLLHDVGMSIHRTDHEAYSLFIAREALGRLLEDAYEEPRANHRDRGGAARDHWPPAPRRALHARGRRGAGRRRARPRRRAARDCRSRPATRASTRSRRRLSTRCGYRPANGSRSGSRSR